MRASDVIKVASDDPRVVNMAVVAKTEGARTVLFQGDVKIASLVDEAGGTLFVVRYGEDITDMAEVRFGADEDPRDVVTFIFGLDEAAEEDSDRLAVTEGMTTEERLRRLEEIVDVLGADSQRWRRLFAAFDALVRGDD